MFIDFEFQLKLPWLFRQKEDSIITWVGFWAAWVDFDVALSGNPQNVPFHIYVVPLHRSCLDENDNNNFSYSLCEINSLLDVIARL